MSAAQNEKAHLGEKKRKERRNELMHEKRIKVQDDAAARCEEEILERPDSHFRRI